MRAIERSSHERGNLTLGFRTTVTSAIVAIALVLGASGQTKTPKARSAERECCLSQKCSSHAYRLDGFPSEEMVRRASRLSRSRSEGGGQ